MRASEREAKPIMRINKIHVCVCEREIERDVKKNN